MTNKTVSIVLVIASSLFAACAEDEPSEPKASQSSELRCAREGAAKDLGTEDPRAFADCLRARIERRVDRAKDAPARETRRAPAGEAADAEVRGTRCQMGVRCSDGECVCTVGPSDGAVCDGASTSGAESCATKCKACEP